MCIRDSLNLLTKLFKLFLIHAHTIIPDSQTDNISLFFLSLIHILQRCGNRLNSVRSDDGTCQGKLTAAKAVAAKCYRKNCIQLHVQTNVIVSAE